MSAARCPLTVIGGFLGAGKTTFLNRLLAGATGRTAVLVNDFGAVNVDAGLIAEHDGTTMRLTNGCVCCSLVDGFLDTLMRVLSEPFDQIVIEASGVGDPRAIAEIALVEPGLVLGAVIVLADASRLAALLADGRVGDTVRRQVEAADILVLNKIDLAGAAETATARAALAALRPGLRIVETVAGRGAASLVGGTAVLAPRSSSRFRAEPGRHEDTFRRILYQRDAAFDPDRLPSALAALPASLLRLKGGVLLTGHGEARRLQMVGARWDLSGGQENPESGWSIELAGIGTEDLREAEVVAILDRALDRRAGRSAA